MLRFRLHHGDLEVEVTPGRFVVGRGEDCNLVLDDPLVSRRHAAFHLESGRLSVEDLGSRNGVQVNGVAIQGRCGLLDGCVVTLGGQDLRVTAMSVLAAAQSAARSQTREGATTLTFEERTREGPTLLARVLEKALAMGRAEEAERILANLLSDAVTASREGRPRSGEMLEHAARCALRVATSTLRLAWVDRVFEAYQATERVMPAPMVDEIHALARRVRQPPSAPLKGYLSWLQARVDRLNASERFAVQRTEALVRSLRSG